MLSGLSSLMESGLLLIAVAGAGALLAVTLLAILRATSAALPAKRHD